MVITVASRHMEVTGPLKSYAESKANKLTKYFDRIQLVEIVIDNSKDQASVEMIVNAEHNGKIVAHHSDGDAYACVDACVSKLERQLSELKKKLRNRKHPAA